MRKKYTFGLLIIISLSFSGTLISVFGVTTYICNVKDGDQIILELLEVDEYYSVYWETKLGYKRKIEVLTITEETDSFRLRVNFWFPIAANETFRDYRDYRLYLNVTKDPTKLETYTPVVLSPVSSYLSEHASGELLGYLLSSNGNTLTVNYSSETYSYTYDSNGLLSGTVFKNDTALLERWGSVQAPGIPGYNLSIVIGLTTFVVLSLVYIWKKRRLIW